MAVLVAGMLAGPWGTAVRADARAMIVAATAGRTASQGPRAETNQPGVATTAGPGAGPAQAAVDAAMPRLVAGRPGDSISVVAVDATTGLRVGWGATTVIPAASVFKLTLLEACLLDAQGRGQPPAATTSAALAAMMESSDNDAADQVYNALGARAGVAAGMRRLGLSSTVLGPHDHWGLSTTTAADQSTLLTNLVSASSPLQPAARDYALRLMSNVEPDQRWGVGAAADPGTGFANKNGWLNVDGDGGRWVVGSVGVIDSGGHRILLAVLTQHDADLADGIDLVQAVSRTVTAALRGAPASSG